MFVIVVSFISLCSMAIAVEYTPAGNINLRGTYDVRNASNLCIGSDCRNTWPAGNVSWNQSLADSTYASISAHSNAAGWANTTSQTISLLRVNISEAGSGDAIEMSTDSELPRILFQSGAANKFGIVLDEATSKFYISAGTSGVTSNAKITINSTGNVGIGTFDPKLKLDVNGSMNVSGNLSISSTTAGAGLFMSGASPGILFGSAQPTGTSAAIGYVTGAGHFIAGSTVGSIILRPDNGRNIILGNTSTILFLINGTTGNIGIGQAIPSQALDVNGDIRIHGIVIGNASALNSSVDQALVFKAQAGGIDWELGQHNTPGRLDIITSSSVNRVVAIRNGGVGGTSLGINKLSPLGIIDINSTDLATIPPLRISGYANTSKGAIHIRPNSGQPQYLTFSEDTVQDKFIIGTGVGATSYFEISNGTVTSKNPFLVIKQATGEVSIGTTEFSQKLSVNGSINITNNVHQGLNIQYWNGTCLINNNTVSGNVVAYC
jgi:hypothetical protein